ncbi:MAG: hypothetical protein ACI8Z1_001705 [Candidatus Azotimanducaceae bacterium]|jgi:hypothetical protein
MDIDGSNQIRLSKNDGIDEDSTRWCNDESLSFSSHGSVIEVDAVDANGDNPRAIVAVNGNDYNFSVDCAEANIVFIRDPGRYVILADRNGGNQKYLGGRGSLTSEQPRFSPKRWPSSLWNQSGRPDFLD